MNILLKQELNGLSRLFDNILREPTIESQLSGEISLRRFGSACQKLGIQIICVNSSQAGGRVEHNHGVCQVRLIYQDRDSNSLKYARRYNLSRSSISRSRRKHGSRSAAGLSLPTATADKSSFEQIYKTRHITQFSRDLLTGQP